jgi:hypothetical protein
MTREELAPILLDAYQRVTDQWLLDVADDERRKLWRDTLSSVLAGYYLRAFPKDIAIRDAIEAADAALAADAEKWGGQ